MVRKCIPVGIQAKVDSIVKNTPEIGVNVISVSEKVVHETSFAKYPYKNYI